jgi:uncharacterized protein YndB with AHSA1/START domain
METPGATFQTTREICASPDEVFGAFSDPQRLARWWGPAGFTNTFAVCEFRPGGRWSFVMHGPNGGNYSNESVFAEVDPPRRIIVEHVSEPKYRLTITLAASAYGTTVSWVQTFEKAEVASRISHIVIPANDENLDRLSAEVSSAPVS